MIAYVDCIPMEPAGKCWNRTYYEDKDELLPLYTRKLSNLHPKTEGSLRRRLLTSKIHQQQDALWHPKCWDAPPSPKIIPPQAPQKRPEYTFTRPVHREWRAVSSLDEESKWSVHYTAPWHQQENVFLPGSRPPCVEELHLQAKVNFKTVLRECDKLRKDGFRSSQYYSQGPAFSSPILCNELDHDETEKKKKSKVLDCLSESCLSLCCHLKPWRKKSSESSAEEEKLVYSVGPQTPLLDNICDTNSQSNWSKSLPLPTPEEKMRQQAKTVATDIIPIDITGESFDRQASFRRTLSNTDTVIRRSKKVKRRKTITGVPDDVQSELAKGQNDARTHSMYMANQFSSTGHEGSVNATLKHSGTHESGCQTEEVKRVPPSMRRIRAQRGCGIAAQMANISLCSSSMSGSISSMSDCNGAAYSPLRNSGDQGFHSLPRQGAQTSLQKQEPKYTSTPYKVVNGSTNSLPYQVTMQPASPSSWHKFADPRRNELISPKSAEFQAFQNGQYNATPGYMVSGQNTSPAPFTANGAMQNFSDFSSFHSAESFETVETLQSMPSGLSDHPFRTAGNSTISAGSSHCHSPASLQTTMPTETESQCSTLNGSTCNSPSSARRDSNFSESSAQSCSTLTIDQWTYERPPKGQRTSSCSSPVSHAYNSLERSPTKTDSSSMFSVDTEGYYTSMHMDSGLKSRSYGAINRAGNARLNMYDCREHHSQGDCVSLHSNRSLTRSISLRKAKKPPLPPKRTDSLRRRPHRKPHQSETALSEQMISSLQESLKNNSGALPSGEFEDPWVLRPRSQSTVSAASSGMSAQATVCPVTPTHSDSSSSQSSSQRSEYAESWDFYMDFPRSHSDQGPSSPNARSASAGESARGFTNGFPSDNCNRTRLKLNIVPSPDTAPHHVTSPSSGYSSQSITPTTGTPVTYVLRAKSPAGRPKPKVPERKSSLRSSVSSSTTSLSSNTSDSYKSLPTPPPLPTNFPGIATLQDAQSLSSIPVSSCSTSRPPPPPSLAVNCTLEKNQSSPPLSPTSTEQCSRESSSISPSFPPPPSESSDSLMAEEDTESPPSSPPPPPPLPPPPPSLLQLHRTLPSWDCTPPSPPPLPGTGLHAETILKACRSSCTTLKSEKGTEESSSKHPQERTRLQRPRITAQALQLVQLKPIKLMKLENIFTDIIPTTVCSSLYQEPLQEPGEASQGSFDTENLEDSSTPDSGSPFDNESDTQESPEEEFPHYMLHSPAQAQVPSAPAKPVCRTYSVEFLLDAKSVSTPVNLQQSPVPSMAIRSTPQKQKPPISPKKPGISLIMPPISPQKATLKSVNSEGDGPEVPPSEPEAINSAPPTVKDSVDLQVVSSQLEAEAEHESGSSTPVDSRRISLSSEFSSDSLNDPQFTAFSFTEHDLGLSHTDLGLSDKDLGLSDDKGIADDGSSSSSGSISFKDDDNEDNGAVFDSSTDISSTTSSPNGETVEEMVTPARPRTTEDLFAAIHRSKRKVLGRGDSEEERSRISPPSPPVTPTGACPSLPASLSRQTGFIQRNLRRSTTSNDSFKALLLKKGSRTDPGFRMSATEILKCTDPRLQRPGSEPSEPDAPCTSPGRSRRAAEEWARVEGALPRLSPSMMSSKYGRSSTPPSAASSRYNSRSRILSGPMTAICEKEGEIAESMDCCLTAEMPFPMSLTSGGTVCAQGST